MTNTNTAAEIEAEVLAPISFQFNGLPCYVVHSDEEMKAVEVIAAENFQLVYYILAATDKKAPRIFKVVKNTVSHSIGEVEDTKELLPVKEVAYFDLPKIPWDLVKKIDAFFRLVDKQNGGSEAIIVLGFDTRCNDSSGWCVIVPEQENSAAHCRYTPSSVVDMIPEEDIDYIQLVGTCHSHPKMQAFCSGTDKGDQAMNDGLHITFGWPSSPAGAPTEFHAEIQSGGASYTIKELSTIFDMDPAKYPEFDEWISRVKKESFSSGKSAIGGTTSPSQTNTGYQGWQRSTHAPDPEKYTVVAEFFETSSRNCPVCYKVLSGFEYDSRRCTRCMSFLLAPHETLDDIIRIRSEKNHLVWELKVDRAERHIAIWRRAGLDFKGKTNIVEAHNPKEGATGPASLDAGKKA